MEVANGLIQSLAIIRVYLIRYNCFLGEPELNLLSLYFYENMIPAGPIDLTIYIRLILGSPAADDIEWKPLS